jgi:hypothetical protein
MDLTSGVSVCRLSSVSCSLFVGISIALCSPAAAQDSSSQTSPGAGSSAAAQPSQGAESDHDHTMEIPGGPALKIRGFLDLNFLAGSPANPLQFPLGVPSHTTFQLGEFDLFVTSKLSEDLSFLAEMVVAADQKNEIGVDLERLQLTYKVSPFFEVSGGRYHTAIGYYSTAFHHGTWFQAATGRPFMYYFEDSGGILPVHNVGVTTTGLVPGTGSTGLHWIAEVGNGRSSSNEGKPVQDFQSDRNAKSTNVAAYIKPAWLEGLQTGANWYHDRLYPDSATRVNQNIMGVYAVYITPDWEFMNEAVRLRNEIDASGQRFDSTLMYTQLSRRFGPVRPYVRFQNVSSPVGDPVNIFIGKYEGPSVGVRYDITTYAALKAQYNRLYQNGPTTNGLDIQVAFTF